MPAREGGLWRVDQAAIAWRNHGQQTWGHRGRRRRVPAGGTGAAVVHPAGRRRAPATHARPHDQLGVMVHGRRHRRLESSKSILDVAGQKVLDVASAPREDYARERKSFSIFFTSTLSTL